MRRKKTYLYIELSVIVIASVALMVYIFDLATVGNTIYMWSLLATAGVLSLMMSIIYIVIKVNDLNTITIGEFDFFDLIDINGWEGQAIRINWNFFIRIIEENETIEPIEINREIKKRTSNVDHRRIDGVYLILGDLNLQNEQISVYVGKTDDLKRRILEHKPKFKWAINLFFFSSAKKTLGDNFCLKLEEKIIKSVKDNPKLTVENVVLKSNKNLNYIDVYGVDAFLKKVKTILMKFGIKI